MQIQTTYKAYFKIEEGKFVTFASMNTQNLKHFCFYIKLPHVHEQEMEFLSVHCKFFHL